MIYETFLLLNAAVYALPGQRVICPSCASCKRHSPPSILFRIGASLPRCISQPKLLSCSVHYRLAEQKSLFAHQTLFQQKTTYAPRSSLIASPSMLSMPRTLPPTSDISRRR